MPLPPPSCPSGNVRDRNDVRRAGVERLQELVVGHAPWLRIRYAF